MIHAEEEQALLTGLREGSASAFEGLYRAYSRSVFTYLWRLTKRKDVAEDLLQDSFFKMAQHCGSLRPDSKLGPWVFTVARNTYRSYRRWSVIEVSRYFSAPTLEMPSPIDVETSSADREALARVERAMQRLPEQDCELLCLVAIEGLEASEVAELLGIRQDTFRQRLLRAREKLKQIVEDLP